MKNAQKVKVPKAEDLNEGFWVARAFWGLRCEGGMRNS